MATTSDIKAGGAYVELTADNAKLFEGLKKAETRIKFFGRAVTGAFVGQALRKMSEEILDVQRQLADGTLEAGQGFTAFGDAIAKSLPILGDYYTAAKNIMMAVDGTAEAIVEAQMAWDAALKDAAFLRKAHQSSKAMEALTKSAKGYTQELQDAAALDRAATDAERDRLQIVIDTRKALEKAAELKKKADEMPLTLSQMDQKRRRDAQEAAEEARFNAQHLGDLRLENWRQRQDENAAKEAQRLAEENAKLAAEQAAFVKGLEWRLHDLKIDAIEDEDARALEKINVRYAREREEILRNGRTQTEQDAELAASERARQQEVANFEAQQARRRWQEEEERQARLASLDDQLAEARDAADASLTDQDRRLRAIDRQEAAALAGAVVGGAVPLDMADRIRQLADLQRAAVGAAEPVTSSSGAFSGAMLQSLQGAAIDDAAETAANTAAIAKSTNEMVRELRKKGQFFL